MAINHPFLNRKATTTYCGCDIIQTIIATKDFVDGLLARNEKNRPLNRLRVQSLVSDIRAGNWKFNGNTIVVDADGNLKDGQHRLTAIREAGYPAIKLIVVTLGAKGEESEAVMRTIDSGKSRSFSDTLGRDEVPHRSVVSAACRTLALFMKDNCHLIPTKSELHEVFAAEYERISAFAPLAGRKQTLVKPTAPVIAALAACAHIDGDCEKVLEFGELVTNGVGLVKGGAAHRLLNYLLKMKGRHATNETQMDTFYTTIRAYAAYRRNPTGAVATIKGDDIRTRNFMISRAAGRGEPFVLPCEQHKGESESSRAA